MWIRVGDVILNTELVSDAGINDEGDVFVTTPGSGGNESDCFHIFKKGPMADAVFEFFSRIATTIYPITPAMTEQEAVNSRLHDCQCGWRGQFRELLQDVGRENVCPSCGRSGRKPFDPREEPMTRIKGV